jgi:ubiquinone/menaquinone biosynthesis C-methylase UbiE
MHRIRRGEMEATIIDVCCGSKMFWFDKNNPATVFMDIRELEDTLCDGRKLFIKPDIIGDFKDIPFSDNTFKLAVFDPPHLLKVGESSWLAKKYGKLSESWKDDIKQGFEECMRVLQPHGILIFKWNEEQIKIKDVLATIKYKPLFGDKRSKTMWMVFMKND